MPRFKVVIWCPAKNDDDDWGKLLVGEKMQELTKAVTRASTIFEGGGFQGIFAAPEYTLTMGGEQGLHKKPIPIKYLPQMFDKLGALSKSIPRVLFVPGTMVYKHESKVWNRAVGFLDGKAILECTKHHDVGEVGPHHTFAPGNGGACATVEGFSVGLQICRDACDESLISSKIELHVVVSAGLALSNVKTPTVNGVTAPRVTIVADRSGSTGELESGGVRFSKNPQDYREVIRLDEVRIEDASGDFGTLLTTAVDYNR